MYASDYACGLQTKIAWEQYGIIIIRTYYIKKYTLYLIDSASQCLGSLIKYNSLLL